MAIDNLYAHVTGTSGIISVNVNSSHSAQSTIAIVEAIDSSLTIGDEITIKLGFEGDENVNYGQVFTGYVKTIEHKEPAETWVITASDVLVKAMELFIASVDPEAPYTLRNMSPEGIVGTIMAFFCDLTHYSSDTTSFTLGINNDIPINLTTVYDYSKFLADLVAFHLSADCYGNVLFKDRKPFPMDDDPESANIGLGNTINAKRNVSDRDSRNRVVVYGASGINAEASRSVSWLPDGFYKTVVLAAPTVIDDQDMAQRAADYNLNLLCRLTNSANATVRGNFRCQAGRVIQLHVADIGVTGLWYVYSAEHSFSSAGYTTSMELRIE